eukprot:767686-Hanusia_phi.AAC.6
MRLVDPMTDAEGLYSILDFMGKDSVTRGGRGPGPRLHKRSQSAKTRKEVGAVERFAAKLAEVEEAKLRARTGETTRGHVRQEGIGTVNPKVRGGAEGGGGGGGGGVSLSNGSRYIRTRSR